VITSRVVVVPLVLTTSRSSSNIVTVLVVAFKNPSFRGGPVCLQLRHCFDCQRWRNVITVKRKFEHDEFCRLQKQIRAEQPLPHGDSSSSPSYCISDKWFSEWENFISEKSDGEMRFLRVVIAVVVVVIVIVVVVVVVVKVLVVTFTLVICSSKRARSGSSCRK